MPEKFKQKYAIKSARLEGYDYSQNGMYFVTICAKDREEYFGEIIGGEMKLSKIGEIVKEKWLKTFKTRKNILPDEWIIMPNHVHGIIEIVNQPNSVETPQSKLNSFCEIIKEIAREENIVDIQRRGVSTMPPDKPKRGGRNPLWKPNSLGSTINQFKSACTKKIWKHGPITFAWQSRFYDHIIRNEIELNKIREYIITNPEMWERDRNNPENVFM